MGFFTLSPLDVHSFVTDDILDVEIGCDIIWVFNLHDIGGDIDLAWNRSIIKMVADAVALVWREIF